MKIFQKGQGGLMRNQSGGWIGPVLMFKNELNLENKGKSYWR